MGGDITKRAVIFELVTDRVKETTLPYFNMNFISRAIAGKLEEVRDWRGKRVGGFKPLVTTEIEPTSQTGPGNFPVIGPGWCSPEARSFVDNSGARRLA